MAWYWIMNGWSVLRTYSYVINYPKIDELKTTNMYYLTHFLRVRNLAWLGHSGLGSLMRLQPSNWLELYSSEAIYLSRWDSSWLLPEWVMKGERKRREWESKREREGTYPRWKPVFYDLNLQGENISFLPYTIV